MKLWIKCASYLYSRLILVFWAISFLCYLLSNCVFLSSLLVWDTNIDIWQSTVWSLHCPAICYLLFPIFVNIFVIPCQLLRFQCSQTTLCFILISVYLNTVEYYMLMKISYDLSIMFLNDQWNDRVASTVSLGQTGSQVEIYCTYGLLGSRPL